MFEPKGRWENIEKDRRWAVNRIKHLAFRGDMENLIIRYATALSQPNVDVAFLYMWSILETLTDTVGGHYDVTIRRTVWAFKNRKLVGELVKSVRCYRNQLVHAARSKEDRSDAAYLVKSFVDAHLVRLLHNEFGVMSLKEYGRCLDLPTDVEVLEKQRRWLGKALRMQEGGAKGNEH